MNNYNTAQYYEAEHWHRFIENVKAGKERDWINLWEIQARVILWFLEEHKPLTRNTKVLEIGPGAIGHSRWFPKGKLFAIDPLLELFKRSFPKMGLIGFREDVLFVDPYVETMKGLRAPFDIILLLNCLDHCKDPVQTIKRISEVIADDGLLFESTTAFVVDDVKVDDAYRTMHPNIFTMDELIELISERFTLFSVPEDWIGETGPNYRQQLHVWKKE